MNQRLGAAGGAGRRDRPDARRRPPDGPEGQLTMICVYIYICMYIRICVYIYIYMYVYLCVCNIYIYIYI